MAKKHSGLFNADGTPMQMPSIMQDGARAQHLQNLLNNDDTYYMYFWRLMDIAMSVFSWTGLPKGVDARSIELWLMVNGFCVFLYDDNLIGSTDAPEGYLAAQASMMGPLDMYGYPKDRRAYTVNGSNFLCDESNSVLIYNNYLRVPMFTTLSMYARRLAEIERTIDVNVMNQKTTKVIRCDEREKLTFKNLLMQVEGNQYSVWANKNLDLDNIELLDLTAPYVSNDLNVLKHQIWNEALTYLGVENVNTEKKERLVSSEVMSNMGDVEAQRFTRLNARKQACEKINELFGLEVECDFRSGIYIKADGYGAQQIASGGMEDGAFKYDGSGIDGIMQSINRKVYGE